MLPDVGACDRLPVDALKDQILRVMRGEGRLVLEAPPGAGKTTRVPRFLLDDGLADRSEIIVIQPRRLAARMAARFVARGLREPVGERVGYQVRFEEAVSARTRVRFITEGLLVRQLASNPTLDGVGCVIFDEFHERHLDADLALTLCSQLRSDLKIIVMSATLDAEPIAEWLGAERLRSEGRMFPVTVEYVDGPGARPLEQMVAVTVRRALATFTGDVLVFLPGVGEIMRCLTALGSSKDLMVVPLHGELSPDEQDRAVNLAPVRKVVLATNVAETSVTIDGIGVVIDTGLARVASHDPWSGMPRLTLQKISRASADQRAGRAGRTREGHCLRMYAKAELMQAFETPEIRRLDLTDSILMLRSLGYDPFQLPWLEPPKAEAIGVADTLLRQLGALDGEVVTPIGKAMLRLPTHPRLARMLVEAKKRGVDASLVAALLSERDVTIERRANVTASADVIAIADAVHDFERRPDPSAAERLGLRVGPTRQALRARDQLRRINGRGSDDDVQLRLAMLAGFPDRVAKKLREPARDADAPLATFSQGPALLSKNSVVTSQWLIALAAEQRGGREPLVRSACAIASDWLIELFADRIVETSELVWNDSQERVDEVTRMTYGALSLDESKRPAPPSQAAAQVLLAQLSKRGLGQVLDVEALDQLRGRVDLARVSGLEMPSIDELLTNALAQAEATSLKAVRDAALMHQLHAELASSGLDSKVPASFKLANGKSLRIHYEPGKPPWVESYLQDFFGTERAPRILDGRVQLTIHLLGPNKRPLQVTSDLGSFWDTHYKELKPALSRRYPKHHWPDDPRKAEAQAFKSRVKA